ncbi:MAG: HesB/IscA family protein [Elusimicrobiota bacterium]|jgi:iron-sulfur cluster assembly protein
MTNAAAIITVTDRAVRKAKDLLAQKGLPGGAIRVKVLAGGCSGMSYDLQPTAEPPQKGDVPVEFDGLKVYLDSKSLLYLAGTELDYISSLMSQKFVFKNPQAKSSCSCGESFTV